MLFLFWLDTDKNILFSLAFTQFEHVVWLSLDLLINNAYKKNKNPKKQKPKLLISDEWFQTVCFNATPEWWIKMLLAWMGQQLVLPVTGFNHFKIIVQRFKMI